MACTYCSRAPADLDTSASEAAGDLAGELILNLEVGGCHLAIDFEEDDFVFDASLSGLTLGLEIIF